MSLFTHVSIKLAAGENLLEAQQWEALPLAEKTRAILSKSVTFIRHGEIIPIAEILRQMKKAA